MGRHAFRRRGRGNPRLRGRGAGPVLAAVLVAALMGCTPTSSSRDADDAVSLDIDIAATWETIRDAQADRLETLATFTSSADATFRFTDENGDARTEQVDLRVWRVAPAQAAVRLSKLGSSFSLSGWNGDRWWRLDESGKTPVLLIDRVVRDFESLRIDPLTPPVLFAMFGLAPWPEAPPVSLRARGSNPDDGPDSIHFELDRIVWSADDGDRVLPIRIRVEIRRPSDGPVRIELLDPAGDRPFAVAELDRPDPVETLGRAPGAWPMLPHRIRIVYSDFEMVIRFDRPLAGGEVSPRLFDLEAVRRRVPDAIVEDRSGGGS